MIAIDGSSLLSSCYFATLPKAVMYAKTDEEREAHYNEIMHASDGTYTNGVYASLKIIRNLIYKYKPDYMIVAFDMGRNTFRRKLYPKYKAQRGTTQRPLKEQFVLFQKVLNEMDICTIASTEYEADDYIASVVKQFESPNLEIKILTKDKDYLQLPSKYTSCWMMQANNKQLDELYKKHHIDKEKSNLPGKIFEFTKDIVKAETGVWPEQIAELKAIQGDSSDNYPGIKGVASAAVPLLQKYENIEGIYKVIDSCKTDNERKELFNLWKKELNIKRNPINYLIAETKDDEVIGRQAAALFKTIATMKTDLDLNLTLNDMNCWWNADIFENICERLNITTI